MEGTQYELNIDTGLVRIVTDEVTQDSQHIQADTYSWPYIVEMCEPPIWGRETTTYWLISHEHPWSKTIGYTLQYEQVEDWSTWFRWVELVNDDALRALRGR